jgi:hypothetical protein
MERWDHQVHLDVSSQIITNAAISLDLTLLVQVRGRKVFNGPKMVPTGPGDDRSGVRITATEYDSYIPREAKAWLGLG